jgi:hypothetical protein
LDRLWSAAREVVKVGSASSVFTIGWTLGFGVIVSDVIVDRNDGERCTGPPWDGAGSGIASYDVYVSEDNGPFTPFLTATTATAATFTGQFGHTYPFHSAATSNVGLVQPTPTAAQATTRLAAPTPPPLVTMTNVSEKFNKKHQVTQVNVIFSGAVNSGEADSTATYRLAAPGKKGSFTAKNATVIKFKSASFNVATDTVTLIPKKPFTLSKPVQLVVYGVPQAGLQDTFGRFIDGNHDGQPGGNAVVILARGGATIDARLFQQGSQVLMVSAVDHVLDREGALSMRTSTPGERHFRDDVRTGTR